MFAAGVTSQVEARNETWLIPLQASYGKCGDPFMFSDGAPDGGYCAATCNRCPPGTSPTPTPTQSLSPGATPAASPGPTCNDTPPDSQYSCEEQASYGKCGDPFMFTDGAPEGGYCAATCNRCPSGTTPTPTATPAATPAVSPVPIAVPTCNDSPPDSQYSCQEQASYGKCGDPFMFSDGAPEGGYCAASCNRCPPGTWSPSQPEPTAPAASPAASPEASPVAMSSPGMTSSPAATMAASPVPLASPGAGSPIPYSPASPTASPVQAVSPAVASPPTYPSPSPVASPTPVSPGSSPAVPVCADVAGPFDCAQQVSSHATCPDTVPPKP